MASNSTYYDLRCIKGSPWSLKVYWALKLLPSLPGLKITEVLRVNSLQSRVKNCVSYHPDDAEKTKVSAPMLFFKNEEGKETVIREGVSIVEFVCKTVGAEKSSFARTFLENSEAILEWNQKCNDVMAYFRGASFSDKDNLAQYFLPWPLNQWTWLTVRIHKYFSAELQKKYAVESHKLSLQECEVVFQEAEAVLQRGNYILGDAIGFSYGDIVVADMLESILPLHTDPPVLLTAIFVEAIRENSKIGLQNRYPNVFQHRARIFADHFPAEIRAFSNLTLTQKIKEDSKLFWKTD